MSSGMRRTKKIRVLRYGVIGLVLFTVVLLAVGMYSLVGALSGAVSGGGLGLHLDKDGPNGDWILNFSGNPGNSGLVGSSLSLHIGVLDQNGRYIASNSTTVAIPAGQQRPFSMTLTIPHAIVQQYGLNQTAGAQATFELIFGVRTLGGLIGLEQTTRIPGNQT